MTTPAAPEIPGIVKDDQAAFMSDNSTVLGGGLVAITRPISDYVARIVPDGAVIAALQSADRAAATGGKSTFDHDKSDLVACHRAAIRIGRKAAAANATTGGVTGIGGAATMLVDLPASIIIATRAIQRIGAAYGFGGDGKTERQFRLAILELAATSDSDVRMDRIATIQRAIGSNGNLTETDDDEESVLEIGVERISRTIAFSLARRQLGASLPIVGGVVGAAVNASFQIDVAAAARFAFQSRRISAAADRLA